VSHLQKRITKLSFSYLNVFNIIYSNAELDWSIKTAYIHISLMIVMIEMRLKTIPHYAFTKQTKLFISSKLILNFHVGNLFLYLL
jgi:hypothetical protein